MQGDTMQGISEIQTGGTTVEDRLPNRAERRASQARFRKALRRHRMAVLKKDHVKLGEYRISARRIRRRKAQRTARKVNR